MGFFRKREKEVAKKGPDTSTQAETKASELARQLADPEKGPRRREVIIKALEQLSQERPEAFDEILQALSLRQEYQSPSLEAADQSSTEKEQAIANLKEELDGVVKEATSLEDLKEKLQALIIDFNKDKPTKSNAHKAIETETIFEREVTLKKRTLTIRLGIITGDGHAIAMFFERGRPSGGITPEGQDF